MAQLDIHAGSGLVQHDDGWLVHQRLRHQHAALHAARELAHIGTGLVSQAQAFQQLVNPGVIVFDTEIAGLDAQHLAHVKKGIKHQFLGYHTQLAAGIGKVALHIAAQHADGTARGARQTRQNADHGGFTRTIGAKQAEEFAFFDV